MERLPVQHEFMDGFFRPDRILGVASLVGTHQASRIGHNTHHLPHFIRKEDP